MLNVILFFNSGKKLILQEQVFSAQKSLRTYQVPMAPQIVLHFKELDKFYLNHPCWTPLLTDCPATDLVHKKNIWDVYAKVAFQLSHILQ